MTPQRALKVNVTRLSDQRFLTESWYLMSLVHMCSSPTTHGISSVLPFRLAKACRHTAGSKE